MCASFTTNALMGKRLNVALSNHGEERKRDEGLYATNLGAVRRPAIRLDMVKTTANFGTAGPPLRNGHLDCHLDCHLDWRR